MNPLTGNVTQTMGVIVRGDASGLTRAMGQGAASTKAFETQATGSAKRWLVAWKLASAGVVVGILAVALGLGVAAKQAADFEKKMRNVTSLIENTEQEYQALNKQVLALAKTVPQAAGNLADGLYDVTSSGFYANDSLVVLTASAKAASAGLTTTDNAVQGVTAVLNAYGLSAASSNDVSDTLFQTVNLGVIRFEELTSVLGKVVGTAAAAKVPIEDVGAAIGAMTLSGISANESGTALNRLLQALLQPSESLAAMYKVLGYESGSAALEQDGLYNVMEKIRESTGGNVDAFLALFPEIRAAKAAFALASDEGKVYARVQGQIGDALIRQGATQRAFDEQMKSTSNQWAILTSGMKSNAVTVGLKILPAFTALIQIGQDMSTQFLPNMQKAYEVIRPFFETLYETGVNVVEILGNLVEVAAPVAGALGKIAGGAVLAALSGLATVLKIVTGFLADHTAIVAVAAGALASLLVPAIGTTVVSLWGIAVKAKLAMIGLGGVSGMAKIATTQLAMLSAVSVTALGAVAAIGAVVAAAWYSAKTAGDEYEDTVNDIQGTVDKSDMSSIADGIADLTVEQGKLQDLLADPPDMTAWERQFWPLGMEKGVIATSEALVDLNSIVANTWSNMAVLSEETGMTQRELAALAEQQGIDFSMAVNTEEAKNGRDQLLQYLGDITDGSDYTSKQLADNFDFDIEEITAFLAAIEKAGDDATRAFLSATDVIGTWKPNIGVEETTTAVENLTEARDNLAKLEKDNARDSDTVINAQKRVADASEALTEAERKKSEGTLTAFYQNAIETSRTFSQNIQRAVELGLDPALVAKLLKEGPEQAGPVVQQLVDDNSGALIQMMNDSEAALAEINTSIVLQARLTAQAVESDTDQMAKDLPAALTISTESINGKTPEEIAKAMGLDKKEVERIAGEFGIGVAESIQEGFDGSPLRLLGGISATPWWVSAGNTDSEGYASGGIYPGYTPGRDTGFISVGGGEAIMRPEWTRAIGPDRINYWNHLARTGGVSAVRQATLPYLGGFASGGIPAPQVVTVPLTQRNETLSPINIERMYAGNVADFERQAADRRRRDKWGGRR